MTYSGPQLTVLPGLRMRGSVGVVDAGPVAVSRAYTFHAAYDGGVTSPWSELEPHEALGSAGLGMATALNGDMGRVWAVTGDGLWSAARSAGWQEVTGRVRAVSYRVGAQRAWCRVELAVGEDEAVADLGGGEVMVGGSVEVAPGYGSGSGRGGGVRGGGELRGGAGADGVAGRAGRWWWWRGTGCGRSWRRTGRW